MGDGGGERNNYHYIVCVMNVPRKKQDRDEDFSGLNSKLMIMQSVGELCIIH